MTDVASALTASLPGGPSLPQERRLVTPIPGPRSLELHARRTAAVAVGVGSTLPIQVVAAGGGVIVDADGNSLIDLGSGIAVVNVGNAAGPVADAVAAQAASFTHTCFMVTPYEGYVAVCERLNRLTPGTHEKRSALFNSGAEAVENAVKIARHATGRSAVVVLDHAYHGRTNLTMALTAKSMPYKTGFGPFAPDVYRVPMAYPYRWPGGPDACGPEAAAAAIDHITTEVERTGELAHRSTAFYPERSAIQRSSRSRSAEALTTAVGSATVPLAPELFALQTSQRPQTSFASSPK